MRSRSALAILTVCGVAAFACGPSQPDTPPQAVRAAVSPPPAPLSAAIRDAVDLGPAGAGTIYLTLGLKGRSPEELATLLAAGQTVSPAEFAARFGPDAALARNAVALLEARGFHAGWRPGSSVIAADGPAPAAALLLGVDIENYRLADGTTFYASVDEPRIPRLRATSAASPGSTATGSRESSRCAPVASRRPTCSRSTT